MSLGRLDVLLVRHAESIPRGTRGWEEADDDRPLTDAGRRAATELADELEPYVITRVYSSPFRRAVETVEPTAERRGLPVTTLADLRERFVVTPPGEDWRQQLRAAWNDPEYAPNGAESGREAQLRGIGVLDLLRVRHPDGGRLLLGSHGNLISLILHALEPGVDADFQLAMPMPAIYHLEHDGIGWRVMGGHGFVPAAPRN